MNEEPTTATPEDNKAQAQRRTAATLEYHRIMDLILSNGGPKLKECCNRCTKSHCCEELACADEAEIAVMLGALTEEEALRVKERTIKWKAVMEASGLLKQERPEALEYRALNLPCPLLENGRCMAYEHRPGDCRMYFALGNPDGCAMPARAHQLYADFERGGPIDQAMVHYGIRKGEVHLDHIGAHLIRLLGIDPGFETEAEMKTIIKVEG
jgi:Fe-S-cluster containining protein